MRAPVLLLPACLLAFGVGGWLAPAAPAIGVGAVPAAADHWAAPRVAADAQAELMDRLRHNPALGTPAARSGATQAAQAQEPSAADRGDWRIAAVIVAGAQRSVSLLRPGQKATELKEGDVLPGGARIVRIQPDHLVITLNGRKARLDLTP